MKKIFSAFLLMTMMVFSVGSFVSCSDIEKEIAALDTQATENAAAIADLNSKIASLQTALSAAQADADAAMAAAQAAQKAGDEAKATAKAAEAAAAQAKADAIAAATEKIEALQAAIAQNVEAIQNLSGSVNANAVEIESLQDEVKALQTEAANTVYAITNLNGSVEKHDAAIEDLETELSTLKASLENFKKNLEELGLLNKDLEEAVSYNLEAITNLQGTLDAQAMAIEDLDAAVKAAVAGVTAINENLVAVYTLVEALANQIQSIVYVPETTDGKAVAQGYALGNPALKDTKKTDLLVKMTYEVSPKGLATAITSENAAFSTVPVKAAAAEYFEVEVAEADASTGRVVVYAHIPTTSEAYKHVAKDGAQELALSLNVADEAMVALLFSDEPQMVDAGTYVQSAYTGVKEAAELWDNVYDNFVIYNTVKKEAVDGTKLEKVEYKVAYDQAPGLKSVFEKYEVRALVDGTYMTVAEAAAFTGFEFEIKNDFKVRYVAGNKAFDATKTAENPFTVTGKDLTTTIQFANNDKVKNEELVNAKAVAAVGSFTVNKVAFLGTIEATYQIVEKVSDFGFTGVETAWKHGNGATVVVANSTNYKELAIVNAPANFDLTKTTIANTKFEAEYVDADDEEQTAVAYVSPMSSNDVKLHTISALPYKKGETATYTFVGDVVYNNVKYTVSFDVVLGAMPTDKAIDLGAGQSFQVDATTTGKMTIENVTPVSQAIAHLQATDSSVKAIKDFVLSDLVAGKKTIKVDGETVTSGVNVEVKFGKTTDSKNEKSTIEVSGLTKYDNTIEFTQEYTAYGVKFTYTATIVTSKPQVSFGPAVAYVTSDNKVNLDGTVKFEYADAAKKATKASTKYVLNEIDLSDYVDVTIPAALANDFKVRYTLKSNPYVKEYNTDGTIKTWKDDPESDPKAKFSTANLPAFVVGSTKTVAAQYLTAGTACPVEWRTDMREMTYEIALVSTTKIPATATTPAQDDVFDSFEVTLVVPELIKTFAADKEIKVKYENGKTASANIASAFTVVDKFDNVVYNAYAPTLDFIWDGYKLDANGKLAQIQNAGFYQAYGQEIVLPAAKDVKAYIGSNDVTKQVNPVLAADGTVTIQPESATLTGDVVVKVPVKLTYLYDEHGAQAKTAEVSVVFSLTEGEVNTPGTGVTVENPDGKQWVTEVFGTTHVIDFGVSTYSMYGNSVSNILSVGQFVPANPMMAEGYYFQGDGQRYEVIPTDAKSGVIKLSKGVGLNWDTVVEDAKGNYVVETVETDPLGDPVLDANGNPVVKKVTYKTELIEYESVAEYRYDNFTGTSVTLYGFAIDPNEGWECTLSTENVKISYYNMF